ncbi:MAG: MBL fold metallo-hydrolase [Patescibacteria group bacterium]|jgi:competence protein ComEC
MRARSARSWAQLFGLITLLTAGFLAALLSQPTSADGLLRVRILDVGQGDAILIDAPTGEHLLVDGGPDLEVVSALSHFLAPPKRFAVVVASHNDADHIAGLPSVLSRYSVESVWLSGALHTTGVYEAWLSAVGCSGARGDGSRWPRPALRRP